MKLEISAISNLGYGIGFDEKGRKIFIPKTVDGDVVEVREVFKNSKFTSGEIVEIIKESAHRRKAECEYFDKCGGCLLQHLKDDFYVNYKIKNVTDLLLRNQIEINGLVKFVEVGKNSRRRANFHIDRDNNLGFFKENSNDLVKINHCLMLSKNLSDLIPDLQKLIKKLPKNFIKQISVCEFDNVIDMVFKLIDVDFLPEIIEKLSQFAVSKNINLSCKKDKKNIQVFAKETPQINIGNIAIDVSSNVFLQASKKGGDAILAEILEFVEAHNICNVLDIYCGVGVYSFALCRLKNIKRIAAFEGVESMVSIINKNAEKHNLKNKIFAEKRDLFIKPLKVSELKNYDLAIINPPRKGANPQILELANSEIEKIITVFCDLNSFARDAKILLGNGFYLKKLTLIDQFYYTAHIELVAIFERRV